MKKISLLNSFTSLVADAVKVAKQHQVPNLHGNHPLYESYQPVTIPWGDVALYFLHIPTRVLYVHSYTYACNDVHCETVLCRLWLAIYYINTEYIIELGTYADIRDSPQSPAGSNYSILTLSHGNDSCSGLGGPYRGRPYHTHAICTCTYLPLMQTML